MKKFVTVLLLGLLLLTGCDYFETEEIGNVTEIEMSINNLVPLPDSLMYAAWLVYGSNDATKFVEILSPATSTNPLIVKAPVNSNVLAGAKKFYVSIVKKAGFDSTTVGTRLLEGTFKSNDCSVGLAGFLVNPQITGVYYLATPTNGPGSDELSGIWFADSISNPSPSVGLDLPVLTGTLTYHAWVEVNGTFLNVGKFTDPSKGDGFNGYSDTTAAAYGKPGEDFLLNPPAGITFPLDLSNANIYISIEPTWLKTSGPSFYNVLTGTVPGGASANTRYELQIGNLPSGFAKLNAI